ncbi:hypothetical protein BUALT_Bualt03G0113200 [Buddleja alternifolia]|uniref:DUF4408 domain-containing protein n=1 Tax=Buddleja alternifolia TaxID=168488 RepID=A0AAV6XU12_9LAMI|nr:hypothetical protein BUALT_Bualt03G0113200 [Buddleja alternifolia]
MENLKKSQIVELILIAALIIVTPLLSTSHRSTYLYFIVNILIVVVGAEAGLLSFLQKSAENTKKRRPAIISDDREADDDNQSGNGTTTSKKPVKTLEKCSSEKIVGAVKDQKAVKKSPSMPRPSIFFIESGEAEDCKLVEDHNESGVGDLSGQELFRQSETFIGNFYKQLKMQRDESWKKLHDHLYQKAF